MYHHNILMLNKFKKRLIRTLMDFLVRSILLRSTLSQRTRTQVSILCHHIQ